MLLNVTYDCYPFGMQMPGRHSSSGDYRYGFQGQEMDDEVKGEGNSVNYKYRMHDPRVGRFFAVDPLTANYPHYTPYSFSGNKVIAHVELEGLEEFSYTLTYLDEEKKKPQKSNFKRVENSMLKSMWTGKYVAYTVDIEYEGHVYHFKGYWDDPKISDDFIADPDNKKWEFYRDDVQKMIKTESGEVIEAIIQGPAGIVKYGVKKSINPKSLNKKNATTNKSPGSRTEPIDLKEKLALDEAKSGMGKKMDKKWKDPKYDPETGTHDKMQHNHDHGDGTSTEIHYDKNRKTGELSGFKIKDDTNANSRANKKVLIKP